MMDFFLIFLLKKIFFRLSPRHEQRQDTYIQNFRDSQDLLF